MTSKELLAEMIKKNTEDTRIDEKPSAYIDTADVAKIVRQELKEVFPNQKFSVRIQRYSGGSSIDVSWTDGIPAKEVEGVIGKYEGATFDGMIDLQEMVDVDINGVMVHFGSHYIQANRHYSDKATNKTIKRIAEDYGYDNVRTWDETNRIRIDSPAVWLSTVVHQELAKSDFS